MIAAGQPLVYVYDKKAHGLGLHISIGADIVCKRHKTFDPRALGIWEVIAYPYGGIRDVLNLRCASRPAVVDDFGSLVFVGQPK